MPTVLDCGNEKKKLSPLALGLVTFNIRISFEPFGIRISDKVVGQA